VRNNPLLYIDPTGHWSIQVKGENAPATKEQREEEEKKLQRLAPGTTVDEYGNVHKAGYWQRVRNHFNGHAAGTALVTSLVDHKASTTIIIGDGHETETRPSGHDAVIYMSPKENAASRVLVWEGNKLRLEKADPAIILGHELIHALHIVQNDDFYAKEATHTVRSGTYSFTEKAGGDELRTIGVPGFVHWGDTNENTLRFELGYRQRAAWHEPSTPPPE
jgi:hypothetical protein